jgi:hypothetical protein
MTLAFKETEQHEFGTKADVHYRFRVTYDRISTAIRAGKLAIHLIDGRIMLDLAEAAQLFGKSKRDLFE